MMEGDDTPQSQELATIQNTMRTNPDAHWRDSAMQARLGELLASGETPTSSSSEIWRLQPMSADESESDIGYNLGQPGQELADEWSRAGGYAANLSNVQRGVMAVLDDLSPLRQRALMERFDQLPAKVIAEVYRAFSLGRPNNVPDASPGEVEVFASSYEGAELVREWGYRAPQKIAVIKDRFTRALNAMGDSRSYLKSWFDGLRSDEKMAILKGIS